MLTVSARAPEAQPPQGMTKMVSAPRMPPEPLMKASAAQPVVPPRLEVSALREVVGRGKPWTQHSAGCR